MNIADSDKCPHCGTPYMSMLAPGEPPDSRYCYSCETTSGGQKLAAQLAAAADGEGDDNLDLELQPLELGPDSARQANQKGPRRIVPNLRKQLQQEIRGRNKLVGKVGKKGVRPAAPPPNSAPVEEPAEPPVASAPPQIVLPEELPQPEYLEPGVLDPNAPVNQPMGSGRMASVKGSGVQPGVRPGTNAVQLPTGSGRLPAAKGSGVQPGVRPGTNAVQLPVTGSGRQPAAKGSGVQPGVRGSAAGIPAAHPSATGIAPVRTSASGMAPARSSVRTPKAPASQTGTYITYAVVAVVVLVGGVVAMKTIGNTPPPETQTAIVAKTDEPKKAEPPPAVAKPAPKQDENKPVAEVKDAAKKDAAESPAATVAPPAETKPAGVDVASLLDVDTARKAAKAKLDDEDAEVATAKAAPPAKTEAKKPDAPADASKPAGDMKDAKAPASGLSGFGLGKKPEPEKPPENPFKKGPEKIQAATSAEPIIVAIDPAAQGESQYTNQLQPVAPGWRVRDMNTEHSKLGGVDHRGRKEAIGLNPISNKLSAKLYATIEIPQKFANSRPSLVFEVASKDANQDWILIVQALNVPLLPKRTIRTKDTAAWQDIIVDLTGLSGKRIEVVIEASHTTKDSKKFKDEFAYLRNLRLEWVGRKSAGAPDKK